MKAELTGVVVHGVLKMSDRASWAAAAAKFPDGPVWVRIDSAHIARSPGQNRLWHAQVVKPFAEFCDVTPRHMHEALKVLLLPETIVIRDGVGGRALETVVIGNSTAELTRNEMTNIIDRAVALAARAGLALLISDANPEQDTP